MMNRETKIKIFTKAALVRNFENKVYEMLEKKIITIPVYLSAGQEFISATIATMCEELNIKPLLFPQHRNHSVYLSFGGNPVELIQKLLGTKDPMEGSASIQCKEINMFGHSGFMGDNVPIGVGACYASKQPTICFFGDGSAEQDYVLGALGWASTKHLPILFVCEDNNLSILTEKKVRRNWSITKVAKSLELLSDDISDDPQQIYKIKDNMCKSPMLINVNTIRKYWHAGAGVDKDQETMYEKELKNSFFPEFKQIDNQMKEYIETIWQEQLEK